MLTKITVRNFKRFSAVEVELGDPVVFIGPNNSGKTSALQALALWDIGLKRWTEKRKGRTKAKKRTAVAINRRDLVAVPVPKANHLWRDLHVRDVQRTDEQTKTQNVRIEIIVEGITEDELWQCGLEFDYANEESIYCRPLRRSNVSVPDRAETTRIAFLPPMSGLAANEIRLDVGAVNVRIGEGRTAEVLRNLCHVICQDHPRRWATLHDHIESLFGARLDSPEYVIERGEITMTYRENGRCLDISSSGRGLQQTLLLLAYMYNNPGAVLLLDEPDAHLEILRQRQIYQLLSMVAKTNGNQIIAASHSEVLLNEAAGRDVVVAFLGNRPHRIDDRGSQVLKSLRDIGFEDYYQAEQRGWVLYLEGSTDLAILQAFARKLRHREAEQVLERPFVHYVGKEADEVRKHFWGVREAVSHLQGVAVFDRLERDLPSDLGATGVMWKRREIENYFCTRETLLTYARKSAAGERAGDLFSLREADKRERAMDDAISRVSQSLETLGKGNPWDADTKASDDFLVPLFRTYFKTLDLPNLMEKKQFYVLVDFLPDDQTDPEVGEKLNAIVATAKRATPD